MQIEYTDLHFGFKKIGIIEASKYSLLSFIWN